MPTPRPGPTATSSLDDTAEFVVPDCSSCGGVLKPDVVFFGENVPAERVQRCYDAVDALTPDDTLLAVGSSLTVMSGFRFVRRAAKAGVPVVIVNRGTTRGDDLATVKLDAGCSEFLTALLAARQVGPALRRARRRCARRPRGRAPRSRRRTRPGHPRRWR